MPSQSTGRRHTWKTSGRAPWLRPLSQEKLITEKRSGDRAFYCPREFNENHNSQSQLQSNVSSREPPAAQETLIEMQEWKREERNERGKKKFMDKSKESKPPPKCKSLKRGKEFFLFYKDWDNVTCQDVKHQIPSQPSLSVLQMFKGKNKSPVLRDHAEPCTALVASCTLPRAHPERQGRSSQKTCHEIGPCPAEARWHHRVWDSCPVSEQNMSRMFAGETTPRSAIEIPQFSKSWVQDRLQVWEEWGITHWMCLKNWKARIGLYQQRSGPAMFHAGVRDWGRGGKRCGPLSQPATGPGLTRWTSRPGSDVQT